MEKKLLAEYKMGNGISFFIPCHPDVFTQDPSPQQQINEAIQDIHHISDEIENGNDEAERFDAYMRNGEESLLRELENNFPL